MKKLEQLKAEQAAIQDKLKTIDSLTTSGDKASAQKAVSLAEELLTTIQEKYPENADAIAGAKMTLANAKLAAGNINGAKTDVEGIIATAKDPAIKDQARLLQARVVLREGQTDKGVQLLQDLSESGATPELCKAAKQIIISIESDHLKVVDRKAEMEAFNLDKILTEKRSGNIVGQFLSMPSKPLSAMEAHERNLNILMNTSTGAAVAASRHAEGRLDPG